MKKWILCTATFLCLAIATYNSSAKELKLDDIFPTDRVIDVQITVSQRDWEHNPVSITGFYECPERKTAVRSAGSSVYLR